MMTSDMKPYPAYKDSGVEWLGEIPAHWGVSATKRVCRIVNGATPKSAESRYWNGDIPWITPEDFGDLDRGYILSSKRKITWEGYQDCGTTMVPVGSLVLSTRAPIGHLGIAGVKLCTNQGCRSLVFRYKRSEVYYFFQFLACRVDLEALGQGSTFSELSNDKLGDFEIAVPPLPEQRAIAAFLDRETAKIDALVAKKERLIELLQEKRTSLISDAVTKGLDSGVEWLGEIPAHWALKRIKHLLVGRKGAIKTGPFGSQLHSSEMMDSEIKVLNQRTVIDRDIRGGLNYISMAKFSELKAFEAFPGDLLVTTRGTIGRCMIIPRGAPRGILHPCLMRIQIDTRLAYDHYIEFLIEESGLILAQLQLMSNSTTIEVIYSDSLKETLLPLPPLSEQRAIAAFLDHETAQIDALVAKVRAVIDRFKELRTALISAAVTGKINVREAAA